MSSTNHSPKLRSRKIWLPILGVAMAGGVFGVVFYLANRTHVPPMPRAAITAQEELDELTRIKDALKALRTGKDIHLFIEKVEALNLAEIDPSHVSESELRAAQEAARAMAHENPEGYRLLGMKFSLEFKDLMETLLDDASRGGIPSALERDAARANRLNKLGGSFLRRAMEKGVIESNGHMHAPRLSLQTMFQARWNHLGGLSPDDSLGPVARKVFFDWTARFSEPTNLNKRLSAIGLLHMADPSYDETLAKAIALYEGGRREDARRVLEQAIADGRQDETILRFASSLKS